MTLAALLLRETLMTRPLPGRLLYATVGVLFVNISIGGTLTPFAAPPVLMVANTWQWDLGFMLTHFGWKAALAVTTNAALATLVFRHHLGEVDPPAAKAASAPWSMTALNLAFLVLVVVFAHHETVFIALLLFFLGIASAYPQHQGRLLLREGLLVAFFLGGLVVLGGLQRWWLQPLLLAMDKDAVFFGATLLTAITDNAALTYLGSLVPGLDPEFQIALVAGAVTGGGLTVVANAPNPAGVSLLKGGFPENAINPLYLLFGALPPTFVAMLAFRLL
jgi:hypothetical protein